MMRVFFFPCLLLWPSWSAWSLSLSGRVGRILRRLEDDGDDLEAERALLCERARDARRTDMPAALCEGFVRLFEFRRDTNLEDPGPCAALAAIHADHEQWDKALSAAKEARRRGDASTFVRGLALRAKLAEWDWDDEDDAREAAYLCEADAISAFSALSMPGLSEDARRRRSARALESAKQRVFQEEEEKNNKPPLQPEENNDGPSKGGDTRPWIAVLTPDANAAHPLSQLLPSALGSVDKFRVALVTLCASDGSKARRRFERAADVVLEAHDWTPDQIAHAIQHDLGAVALVDMCGHAGSRDVLDVVVRRPAPLVIQGGLGTPALPGPGVYDYTLCDDVVVPNPNGNDDPAVIRMPFTYFCADREAYDDEEESEEKPTRSSYGLRDGAVVLCCANRPHKVEAEIFDRWIDAMKRLEALGVDAQLWLLNPSADARERARRRANGSDIVFADRATRAEHLRRLALADVALDTRVYGSHTLACDYARAGVPLVTVDMEGDPWHRRVGTAVSRAALTEPAAMRASLEASDWQESYVETIVSVATNGTLLRDLSAALRQGAGVERAAPLWDARRWGDGFERGLEAAALKEDAAQNQKEKKKKESIDVPKRLPRKSVAIVLESKRLGHFDAKIAAELPEVEKAAAVDGQTKTDELVEALKTQGLSVAPVFGDATTAQIACACSHVRQWRRIAADDSLRDGDFVLVLEDDATFPKGGDAFRREVQAVLEDLRKRHRCDLCYLYVYPGTFDVQVDKNDFNDDRDRPPGGGPASSDDATMPGFRTWCLLAYLVSKGGARRLLDLLRDDLHGEIYSPLDCIVADLFHRGNLDVRVATHRDTVDNGGQLDIRPPAPGKLPSNLWGRPPWFTSSTSSSP